MIVRVDAVGRGIRRAATAALGALLVVAGLAAPAGATAEVTTDRLRGDDRFGTAAAVAAAAYPGGAATVLVASGRGDNRFGDGLAGSGLAGRTSAPLLLTERDTLPAPTSKAIDDLNATNVVILGGPAAVSATVEAQLRALAPSVTRIEGDDRYDTAAQIARAIGQNNIGSTSGRRTALVATGLKFPDALAASPLAAGGVGGGVLPVLLVNDTVPATTSAAISDLDIDQVILLGGTQAISTAVEIQLEQLTGNESVRYGGNDRFETAMAVAEALTDVYGYTGSRVFLANGLDFADSLSGGPYAGKQKAPIVLTHATSLPVPTRDYLQERSATVSRITAFGGQVAVSDATLKAAETAAESPPPMRQNETVTVSPATFAEQSNGTTRSYTASGLGTTAVDIALLECADLSTTPQGDTVFRNANGNAVADATAETGSAPDLAAVANASITSVNGSPRVSPTNDDFVSNAAPATGSVTFVVTGPTSSSTASVCVIPVVFVDVNASNSLTGAGADGAFVPTEGFGTGGETNFSPGAAGSGEFGAHDVSSADKGSDRFVACPITSDNALGEQVNPDPSLCRTFRYDSGDTFQLDGAPSTMAVFESRLSPDDDVRGTYSPTGASTFNLADEAPLPPASATATGTESGITVTWPDSATGTVDSYHLHRETRPASGTCPAFTAGGYSLLGSRADTGNGPPAPTYSFTDTAAVAGTTYCYVVTAVDDGDEGDSTAPVSAARTLPAGAPTIVSAAASDVGGDGVGPGDQHTFTFSEAIATPDSDGADASAYELTEQSSSPESLRSVVRITCGVNATCVRLADTTKLVVTLTGEPAAAGGVPDGVDYPAVLTAMEGIKDAGGVPVNVAGSSEQARTMQGVQPNTGGPFITSAVLVVGSNGLPDRWDGDGDVIELTFSELVQFGDTPTAGPSTLTEEEVEAILGTMVNYGLVGNVVGTLVGANADGRSTKVRLTIPGTATMIDGVMVGDVVDGTANAEILDAASTNQQANPTADPVLSTPPS